jgi:hypothetical protein
MPLGHSFRAALAVAAVLSVVSAGATPQSDLNDAMTASAAHGVAPPRLNDPATAEIVRHALDDAQIMQTDIHDMGAVLNTCQPVMLAIKGYMTWGAPNPTPIQMGMNGIAYQAEIALGYRAVTACAEIEFKAAEVFWASLPDGEKTAMRRQGVASMRDGIAQIYEGAIMFQKGGLEPENSAMILDAVVAHAPAIAREMTPAQRTEILATIKTIRADASPDVAAKLDVLQSAMSGTDCTGLCAI